MTSSSSPFATDLAYEVTSSKQTRSRETQAALLDAAEALFAEKGVEATTVADIATRAGASKGAFYHHFGDKQAIEYAVFDRFVNESEAGTLEAIRPERWTGATVGEILQSYTQFLMHAHRQRPSFKRAGHEVARRNPELTEQFDRVLVILDQGLRDLVLARRDEIGHPEPEIATTYAIDQIHSMLRSRHHDRPLPTRFAVRADDEFLRETVRSVCGYLQVDAPAAPEQPAAADT